MTFGFGIIVILSILTFCRAYAPAANPPMLSHASMDVGNIISIVIPESPDENINVDQLTGEFRQQLERIKKQSRASKVEHGLVTLKRVLPEMSREEKRKTLPLIRRVLHGRRVSSPGNSRNWTRETRMEQLRDGGQYMRGRSPGGTDERRINRDFEEMGNREAVTTRNELGSAINRDEYRRISERAFGARRDDMLRREDQAMRRDDQATRENVIRRGDNIRSEDRVVFPDEEAAKLSRPLQEWNNQNWDDQTRSDVRIYPETSTADCDYKPDRLARQKVPGNEILQSEKFDKTARLGEAGMVNSPEEMNADYTKINQRVSSRYPQARSDGNAKRNVKDYRGYETADLPAFVNIPRELDPNTAIKQNCDGGKKNHSGQFFKELQTMSDYSVRSRMQHQGSPNFESEDYRGSQKIAQDPREHSERSNNTAFENIASESLYNYANKKKRGHEYIQDTRGPSSVRESRLIDRWNAANYDDRQPINSSDEPTRDPPNVYEIFGEKSMNPGLSYGQTEQGNFRPSIDNERKTLGSGSQSTLGYGNAGLAMRIQRAINVTAKSGQVPKLNLDQSIFERLTHLLKSPQSPMFSYNRVILVYGNENGSQAEGDRETFTEAEKSHFTSSPSIAEPSSSTSHDLPSSDRPTIDLPRIPT